jgi:hypothetical protein
VYWIIIFFFMFTKQENVKIIQMLKDKTQISDVKTYKKMV